MKRASLSLRRSALRRGIKLREGGLRRELRRGRGVKVTEFHKDELRKHRELSYWDKLNAAGHE